VTTRESAPRLGRGLAALLGDAATSRPASEGVRSLPIDALEPGPFQPRQPLDPATLKELARPDPGRPDRFQIIAGERRWRAAQAAGLHEIPALVRPLADAEAMVAALVENLQRQDLNPMEEAEGYRRLLQEFSMTQDSLGESVGKSRSHVANTLRLLNLPPRVQAEVRGGGLSAGHARALLAHPEPEKAALIVIARGLNVRQTEALSAQHQQRPEPGDRAAGASKDPDTTALEHMLGARLGLRVEISARGTGGTLRIHYRSADQLEGVLTLLTRD
jgi:ParB family chromosome partitioning protein